MKKRGWIFPALFVLLGLLLAIGPQTIFPVCGVSCTPQASSGQAETDTCVESEDSSSAGAASGSMSSGGTRMKCFWTGRAELGIGLLISITGILLALQKRREARAALSMVLGLAGVLALLVPTVLIGVCAGAHMACRSLTLPALTIFSAAVIALAAANVWHLHRTGGGGDEAETADNGVPGGS